MNHPTPKPSTTGIPRWLKWGALGLIGIVVVGYGLIFLYAKVINDSPDELNTDDRDAVLADPESVDEPGTVAVDATSTVPADDVPALTTASSEPAVTESDDVASGGTWAVTDASELGYRVTEVLFGVDTEAVGRTNEITGGLTIDGNTLTAAEFVVDVASISSDESRRDGQFRGRIMSADKFPTASFTLTEPVELGTDVVEGATAVVTATGELTLRGVTNPVSFELDARLENGKIGVLGAIPVVFADYGIANPSVAGITTEDNGLLEFVLVFAPA